MAKAQLMGILNITSDSFYEKSRTLDREQAIEKALQLQTEGADILDIGGESSRPGSTAVSESEELNRVIPVIKSLRNQLSIPLSIDTTKPHVAKAAIEAGVSFLNDVTGFSNPLMVDLAKDSNLDICVMHMLGNPHTMQQNPQYQEGVVSFLEKWFKERTESLITKGINPEKIILDPGIGFGKTVADNLEIIHNLARLKQLGFRLLIGVSRKWFLGQILKKPTHELLTATLTANTIALLNGVDMIRVHDVKEHRHVIDFLDAYQTHNHEPIVKQKKV